MKQFQSFSFKGKLFDNLQGINRNKILELSAQETNVLLGFEQSHNSTIKKKFLSRIKPQQSELESLERDIEKYRRWNYQIKAQQVPFEYQVKAISPTELKEKKARSLQKILETKQFNPRQLSNTQIHQRSMQGSPNRLQPSALVEKQKFKTDSNIRPIKVKCPEQNIDQLILYDGKKKFFGGSHSPEQYIQLAFQNHQQSDESVTSKKSYNPQEGVIKAGQVRQQLLTNIMSQIDIKYDSDQREMIQKRRDKLENGQFRQTLNKTLHKYQATNSSVNSQLDVIQGISPRARITPTMNLQLRSKSQVTRSPERFQFERQIKQRLGKQFARHQDVIDFIQEEHEISDQNQKQYLRNLDKFQEKFNQRLSDKLHILDADKYDYNRLVNLSFHQQEQNDSLKEVKNYLLGQMPVHTSKFSLQMQNKKLEYRISKDFKVEDIFKYLQNHSSA